MKANKLYKVLYARRKVNGIEYLWRENFRLEKSISLKLFERGFRTISNTTFISLFFSIDNYFPLKIHKLKLSRHDHSRWVRRDIIPIHYDTVNSIVRGSRRGGKVGTAAIHIKTIPWYHYIASISTTYRPFRFGMNILDETGKF